MGSLRKFGGVGPPPVSDVQGTAASNRNTLPGMAPPSNVRKALPSPQVSDAGAAAQKSQPPQLPFSKQAQIEEMMNPQHRPLTQELVQMAMAKTAERVALIEESERQRGLPPTTTKVASDETDESIGTDFAEKLASAVEFILPEVQAKEAGIVDSVGGAVNKGLVAIGDHAANHGIADGVRGAIGRTVAKGALAAQGLSNKQLGGGALALGGGALVAGGGALAAHQHNKQAGAKFDKAKDVVKAVAGKAQATASRGKDAVLGAASKGKEKAMNAASSAKGVVGGKRVEEAKKTLAHTDNSGAMAQRVLGKDLTRERVLHHGSRAAIGTAAAVGTAVAGKKIHDKVKEAAALPASFKANAAKVKDAFASGAGKAKDAVVGAASKGKEKARAAADATGDALVKHRGKAVAAGVAAGAGLYVAGKKIHDKSSEKKAEDAINPAHISGKASPLAAAPVRTETGQDGPPAQGNTGALSSNAAAIAFSNAKNQGMKAEQLRKYFSNAASSQHGDPALTKNFAHKTASDKVAEAQHILSALAAQVEGK